MEPGSPTSNLYLGINLLGSIHNEVGVGERILNGSLTSNTKDFLVRRYGAILIRRGK